MKTFCIKAALGLLLVATITSALQLNGIYEDEEHKSTLFHMTKSLHLQCNGSDLGDLKVIWKKEDVPITEIKGLSERVKTSVDKNTFHLKINPTNEHDAGNYSCVAVDAEGNVKASANIRAASHIKVKVADSINVVEGEKLRIHCMVYGNPVPEISWNAGNETDIRESTGRYIIEDDTEKKIPNAVFIIEAIEMSDRGEYECVGQSPLTKTIVRHKAMVRVKDKYAALWPFLGICAEVFVLCAIIFIYEKKRNKTELEESDTDQSPDQKNTPDHGKDSNLRHRQ